MFLVSDSSRDFLRVMASAAYALAPEHVIGSEGQIDWQEGQLRRQARVIPLDDGPGKPAHLWDRAGRLPLLAGGNAEGDIELLDSAQHSLLVRHDDSRREYAYEDQAAMDAAASGGVDGREHAAYTGRFLPNEANPDWKDLRCPDVRGTRPLGLSSAATSI